jgi:adenine-specific DNA methylase
MSEDEKKLKIEDNIPIRTIGIETERERKNFTDLPPQNYVHIWYARRPTPASRLAVLSSVLPEDVDDDQLLKWMKIDPNNKEKAKSIAEHVREKKKTEDDRDGFVYEHYGYKKIWKQELDQDILDRVHEKAKDAWDDELPTVLDATAGGGSIPLESVKYGLPTIANELNPVASVILKSVLDHPRTSKDLSDDIEKYGKKINERVRGKLSEYFETKEGERVLAYLWAHTVQCPDCGLTIPLSPNWWLDKESGSEGIAAKPEVNYEEDKVEFEVVELPKDVNKSEYDPTKGTVSYGKATCPRCNVTMESDEVQEQSKSGDTGDQLYAVFYERKGKTSSGRMLRSPIDKERESFEKVRKKMNSDPDLASILDIEIPKGKETERTRRHGINKWRDMYNSRQLLTHYTYLDEFRKVKDDIEREYTEEEAEVIKTYLALVADKAVDYNSKMCAWVPSGTKIGHSFDRHDFAFKWSYVENNLVAEGFGYEWPLENTIKAYKDFHRLTKHAEKADTQVLQENAGDMSLDSGEIDVVVLDPPYYDNVMYAELSDFFYVWLEKYLGDVYPEFFESQLTDKEDEAVANPSKFDDVASDEKSSTELAKEDYEGKMTDIFDEMYRVLQDEGVFTLMFTHKKTEAWDTLTKALINSGFTVKATHPVNTESSLSLHQKGKNAAESTIFLVSEKREQTDKEYTLWNDIKDETRKVAREKAAELDKKGVEFTKVDMMLAAFGPTLEVFTKKYPVVNSEGDEVQPEQALDEARDAVSDYLIDQYLNEGIKEVDPKTEWYVLSWLIFEAERFPYDEGRRLAIGVGEDIGDLKKRNRLWRKKSGDINLRPHEDRVRDITKDKSDRKSKKPVDPEAVSFDSSLDKVHAAMHVYKMDGERDANNWLSERSFASDPGFKATLKSLLKVLPRDHDDWKNARDLASGKTGEYLDIDLNADIFKDSRTRIRDSKLGDHT